MGSWSGEGVGSRISNVATQQDLPTCPGRFREISMDAPRHCRITIESLLDYIDDRADEKIREEVHRHLDAGCPRCAPQVAALQRLLPALREAMRYQAPESVIAR